MPAAVSISTYQPSPKQNSFHADNAKCRLLNGAYGAGKSAAMIWDVIAAALEHPGSRIVIFRRTYPSLRDTTWRDFLNECPAELIVDEKKTEGREEVTLINGSHVIARCLDDWRKLGSAAFDFICVDEAIEIDEQTFDMLLKGRLRGKIGPRRMILATNPPMRNHWLYNRFVKAPEPNMSVHQFATYDNYTLCQRDHPKDCDRAIAQTLPNGDPVPEDYVCHHNLPPEYISGMESRPENWKRRFLYGEWGFTPKGMPVFPEFKDSLHVAPLRIEPGITVSRGWDFGWQHPACVWLQVLPTGHVNILHELLGDQEDIRVFARRVHTITKQKFPGHAVVDFCDIAGIQTNDFGQTAVAALREMEIRPRFRKLSKWKTIDSMREMLARIHIGVPLLRLDPGCQWLREGFEGAYIVRVKSNGEEDAVGQEDGVHAHCMDALRYALADILIGVVGTKDRIRTLPLNRPRIAV